MSDISLALDELLEKTSVIKDYCEAKTDKECDLVCPFSRGKYCLFDLMGMGIPMDWNLNKEET